MENQYYRIFQSEMGYVFAPQTCLRVDADETNLESAVQQATSAVKRCTNKYKIDLPLYVRCQFLPNDLADAPDVCVSYNASVTNTPQPVVLVATSVFLQFKQFSCAENSPISSMECPTTTLPYYALTLFFNHKLVEGNKTDVARNKERIVESLKYLSPRLQMLMETGECFV